MKKENKQRKFVQLATYKSQQRTQAQWLTMADVAKQLKISLETETYHW